MKLANVTKSVLPSILLVCFTSTIYSQQIAFPGAEGHGKFATGGRGGKVYEVTILNNSGPGSLGEAIGASGPRTVVFRIAGTIEGNFNIRNGNITIAGQTAPGDGICIKGSLNIRADNVIIRYIRVRFDPSTGESDAIFSRYNKNIIIDHVSASWSTDEVMSLYHNENVTIQWCMITEACPKGSSDSHRFGGIWGNNYGTYHHNLIAHNDSRNPRWASGCKYNDYRNNVLYNWGYQSCYGGEAQQAGRPEWNFTTINMVANYYKPGPATKSRVKDRIAEPSSGGSWFVADNVVVDSPEVSEDNWKGIDGNGYIKLDEPWDAIPINQQSPQDAYEAVLAHAGCSLPNRDVVDKRIVEEVRTGTAKYGNNGIITIPSDVGGWPKMKSIPAPSDGDHDGMPDEWEEQYGLNPGDAGDNAQDADGDGYVNLEEYLNGTDPTDFVDYTKPENNVNTLMATANDTVAIPDGYATENGGTTGGGSAAPVTVSTASAFRSAVNDDTHAVIVVEGRIDLESSVTISSNKTIIGADTSSGLYGGKINVKDHNYIFQNLTLGPTESDIMEISGGTNVFVHKCEFLDSTDESLSIVREADFVTVSWCKFHFTESHSHAFGHLIGNRTDRISDRGKLHTTMHHNWYSTGVRSRMPRVRYGHVHIYNNYYNSPGNNYCIGVGHESHIKLENSHFENVNSPWNDMDSPGSGEIGWTGIKFEDCSQPTFAPNAFPVFRPPYEYTMDPVDEVKAIVTAGAGNVNVP